MYICTQNIWSIFGLKALNNNVFELIANLLNKIAFTWSYFSLSLICKLLFENKAQVSCNQRWDNLRLHHWHIHIDLCLEEKYKMKWRIETIRYLYRLTCASWIPCLGNLGLILDGIWALNIDLFVNMVMVAHVGYPLGFYINMLIGLSLCNFFVTWEVSLVWFSLGSSLELKNPRVELGSMIGSLNVMTLGTCLGKFSGYQLDSIFRKNCCCTWLGPSKFLWHFNWVPIFSIRLIWHLALWSFVVSTLSSSHVIWFQMFW